MPECPVRARDPRSPQCKVRIRERPPPAKGVRLLLRCGSGAVICPASRCGAYDRRPLVAVSRRRSAFVQNYFADFTRNSSADFKRAQVRQGVVHRRLGATLDNISQQAGDAGQRAPAERMYSNVYLSYSNYVHAKNPEIMDLYGGVPGRFHLDGMRGTPKDEGEPSDHRPFIDTAATALKLMVSRLRVYTWSWRPTHQLGGTAAWPWLTAWPSGRQRRGFRSSPRPPHPAWRHCRPRRDGP